LVHAFTTKRATGNRQDLEKSSALEEYALASNSPVFSSGLK
jgi:hypothetical protein